MRKDHPFLLVDIGSANTAACMAERAEEGTLISHASRTSYKNVSGAQTEAIAAVALTGLKENLSRLRGTTPIPRVAHVFLAAPWYAAHISTIASESQRTLRIGQGTLEKVIQDYKEKRTKSPAGVEIESVVSQAYVNGYPTSISRPLHGNALRLVLYESEADGPFLKSIAAALRAEFPGIKTIFHSFPFAAFSVLRSVRDEQSFIFADVGGEITDVAVVSRGSLSFIGSFPLGFLSLLRSMAGKGSVADAASRLSLLAKEELSASESENYRETFRKAMAPWMAEYRKILQEAGLLTPVPNSVFLISDKEELSWFSLALSGSESPFTVHPIPVTHDFFQNKIRLGDGGVYDAFLSIAALYVLEIANG